MRRTELAQAEKCEWCGRPPPIGEKLDQHHVAQGSSRGVSDEFDELKVYLCRPCHNTLHECSKHARAIGLALIYRAGRGFNLSLFHQVTNRKWPYESDVRAWVDRLGK